MISEHSLMYLFIIDAIVIISAFLVIYCSRMEPTVTPTKVAKKAE
jgi:hypothetical protein